MYVHLDLSQLYYENVNIYVGNALLYERRKEKKKNNSNQVHRDSYNSIDEMFLVSIAVIKSKNLVHSTYLCTCLILLWISLFV